MEIWKNLYTTPKSFLSGSFSSVGLWPESALEGRKEEFWKAFVSGRGATLVETLKIRSDGRVVLMVDHRQFGRCILKAANLVTNPRQGFANHSIAMAVSNSGSEIFPTVYEHSISHTLERFIDGRNVREWVGSVWDPAPIKAYFNGLKKWSVSYGGDGSNLSISEVRSLSKSYIDKCLSHYRYGTSFGKLRSAVSARRERSAFAEKAAWLWAAADDVRIPRSMVCGDMSPDNLVIESGSGRMYNIDYECMGFGHWGFDAAYFVSIIESDPVTSARQQMRDLVLTDEYLGGAAQGRYFRCLAELLADIGKTVLIGGPKQSN